MECVSFLTGAMSAAFAFALFSNNEEDEIESDFENDDSELEINDFSVRHVTLSCQTCSKLKKA